MILRIPRTRWRFYAGAFKAYGSYFDITVGASSTCHKDFYASFSIYRWGLSLELTNDICECDNDNEIELGSP